MLHHLIASDYNLKNDEAQVKVQGRSVAYAYITTYTATQYNTVQRAHDESYAYNTIAARHNTTAH